MSTEDRIFCSVELLASDSCTVPGVPLCASALHPACSTLQISEDSMSLSPTEDLRSVILLLLISIFVNYKT